MKINGNRWALACLSIAVIAAPAAFAQQQPSAPDAYQGVSQPPADDAIIATPDTPPPPERPEQPAATPKPSAAIPAPPPPAATSRYSAQGSAPSHPRAGSSYDNTDFGIVTVPVQKNAQDDFDRPSNGAVLHTREDPDADIVNPPPGPANELPEGTEIRVRLGDSLSTTDTAVGAPFHGQIMRNVMKGGSVIIPAGSTLRGRVVHVSQGHHFGPAATLRLRPDIVILPDGTAYHLHAQVYSSEAEGTKTGSEGGIKPTTHALKKTAEYGVGVGTGAMVGAELAGPAGALAGSLVGAGIITTHLLLQHPEAASVPAGSEVDFSLTEPLDMTPTRN
jgi:hypothetical protein